MNLIGNSVCELHSYFSNTRFRLKTTTFQLKFTADGYVYVGLRELAYNPDTRMITVELSVNDTGKVFYISRMFCLVFIDPTG